MSHTYSLTMTRPNERFGLAQTSGRQFALRVHLGWQMTVWAALFISIAVYLSFMITSSAKGFQLRDAERRVERLQSETRAWETQVATLSSVQQLSDRARALGFLAVERIESVNAAGHAYALAR